MSDAVSSSITSLFAQIWRLFSLPFPLVGLSCAQILLGCFVVALSIGIAKNLLSLVGILNNSAQSDLASGSRRFKGWMSKGRYMKEQRYSHAKNKKED